jgi:mono/diheme cytochrome c family protein
MNKHQLPLRSLQVGMAAMVLLLAGCMGNTQSPGLEYMPDMYRGPAIEAYVDFGQDPYYIGEPEAAAQRDRPSARVPAEGTIPFNKDPDRVQYNMPYPYPNTNEGYEAAGTELRSPIPMTEATVAQGEILYNKFCVHCHGGSGQGDGPVVERGGHAPPGSFTGPLQDLSEGKMFHVVTYGKGLMGPHAPLLNKEERWLVIQYVKFLQNEGQIPGQTGAAGANATGATGANVNAQGGGM